MTTRFQLATEPFQAHAELERLAQPTAGAVASFVGYCRDAGPNGPVAWLELEHYPRFTETEIQRTLSQISNQHGLLGLLVIHRVGRILPGEAIVAVGASSTHRAAAFAAVEQAMDYLKTEAPFWKREQREDGVHWIEPTLQDYARSARHQRAGDNS